VDTYRQQKHVFVQLVFVWSSLGNIPLWGK